MGPTLFDEIRQGAAWVVARARSVTVRADRIAAYCAGLPAGELALPELDPRHHYLGHGLDTAAFLLILDTINFGSGYFPALRKLPGLSGYFTVATHLTRRFHERGCPRPDELAVIGLDDCRELFQQDPGNETSDELMSLFSRALNELGELLVRRYAGSYAAFLEAAGGSAERLARNLAQLALFDDRQTYAGARVAFFKRAQLTAADLHLAFDGAGHGRFDDISSLTIFADNLIPHVLRCDGILEYAPALAARIDHQQLVARDSREEIEIRASALFAVEQMVAQLRAAGRDATALQLDYLLWNRGQEPSYKARPRHRTRSWSY
ncbi:MAG TPA: queuosine salvage family protein [Kofleriaceae bacterium]|nr:queuosine salvage family protein [Kofleriaceae bacterium]